MRTFILILILMFIIYASTASNNIKKTHIKNRDCRELLDIFNNNVDKYSKTCDGWKRVLRNDYKLERYDIEFGSKEELDAILKCLQKRRDNGLLIEKEK